MPAINWEAFIVGINSNGCAVEPIEHIEYNPHIFFKSCERRIDYLKKLGAVRIVIDIALPTENASPRR